MSYAPPVFETRGRAKCRGPRRTMRIVDPEAPRGVAGSSPAAAVKRFGPKTSHLVALVAALAALFVIAPASLAGGSYGRSFTDNGSLVDATRTSFAAFWSAGSGDFPPALQSAVDYWARYHVVKALIAGLLLAVLLVLGARVGRALSRSGAVGGGRTATLIAAAVGIAISALVAIVLVTVNVQGAMAPFASLLSLLGPEQRGGDLAATVDQVRQALAQPAGASGVSRSPALDTIVDDFAHYHAVFAVVAAVLAAGFVAVGVQGWRARRSAKIASVGVRRMLGASGVSSVALTLLMLVVAVANLSNATAPEEGVRIFFGGV